MLTSHDILQLDDLLTEDQLLIRSTARQFVDDTFMPLVEEAYEKGEFPRQLVPQLGELGLIGAPIPEAYGGSGVDYMTYGLINMELERGDSGLRSFVSVQTSLVMWPILEYGSEEQKQHYLPKLASGEMIGCFGLTEADHGSNPGGMQTHAVETDDGYVLNGSKMWITNGNIADVALIWAKLGGEVRGFLVPTSTPGFDAREQKGKLSLRASVTSELFLSDVKLPKDALMPGVKGLRGPLSCLNQARFGIAFGALGAAIAVYDIAVRYSRERIQFDRPIAAFQVIQERLVWIMNEITKGYLMARRIGELKDSGKVKHYHISLAKRNNVRIALESARMARSILGGNGIMSEYHIMRHMCNLESVITYEGTDDIHTLILGKEITGVDAIAPALAEPVKILS